MTEEQWLRVREEHPGKRRYITLEGGKVVEWKWSALDMPLFTRLWTVEGMGEWHRLDNDDRNHVMGREWNLQMQAAKKRAAGRRGNKKADVDPAKL